jgi:hypothetical protein
MSCNKGSIENLWKIAHKVQTHQTRNMETKKELHLYNKKISSQNDDNIKTKTKNYIPNYVSKSA